MKKSMLSLIVLGLSFLFSTDESVFLKQVELENIYKFKIESFLEKIYDKGLQEMCLNNVNYLSLKV